MPETNDKPLAGVVRAVNVWINRDDERPIWDKELALIIQRESEIGELVEACQLRIRISMRHDGYFSIENTDGEEIARYRWRDKAESFIADRRSAALAKLTKED